MRCKFCLLTDTIALEFAFFILRGCIYIKVKQSRYRPGQAQRFPGSKGSQISWQRLRMMVKFESYAPAAFIPQEILLVPQQGCRAPMIRYEAQRGLSYLRPRCIGAERPRTHMQPKSKSKSKSNSCSHTMSTKWKGCLY